MLSHSVPSTACIDLEKSEEGSELSSHVQTDRFLSVLQHSSATA